MKIKLSTFFSIAIVICTLIMLRYPLIFPQLYLGGYYRQRFVVAVVGIVGMIVLIINGGVKKEYCQLLKWYLIPYTIVILLNIIYTKRHYNYSLNSTIFAITPYLYVYMSLMIVYVMEKAKQITKKFRIIWTVVGMQIAMLIIKTIGWIQLSFFDSDMFYALVTEAQDWVRNGLQRVYGGQLIGLAFVFLVFGAYFAKNYNRRIICLLLALYTLGFILFITQGKFQVMAYTVTFFVMYFYSNQGKIKKVQLFLLISLFLVLFVSSDFFGDFLNIFTITGKGGLGNAARLKTLAYYFGELKKNHWFMGLGMLDSSNPEAYHLMEYNEWRLYYLDDIGIFGGVARFGILSLVIYGWLIVLIVKTIKLTRETKNARYRLLSYGICVYFLVSNIMLNIFEQAHAFSVPFLLAIISYIYGDMTIINKQNQGDKDDNSNSEL